MLYIYKMVNGNYLASTKVEKVLEVVSIEVPYKNVSGLYNRVFTAGGGIWLDIKGEFSPENLDRILELAVSTETHPEEHKFILAKEEDSNLRLKLTNMRDPEFPTAIHFSSDISSLAKTLKDYVVAKQVYDISLEELLKLIDGEVCDSTDVPYISRATGVTLEDYEAGKIYYILEKGDSFHVTSKVLGSFNATNAVDLLKELKLPKNGVLDKKQLSKLKSKTNYKTFK